MKKMTWSMPQMHEVQFEANEYVSICVTNTGLANIGGVENWGVADWATSGAQFNFGPLDESTDLTKVLTFSELKAGYVDSEEDERVLAGDAEFNSGTVYELKNVTNSIANGALESLTPKYLFVSASKDNPRMFLSNNPFTRAQGTWS